MPRDSLHAEVGNPNNLKTLPRTPPVLSFRTQVHSRSQDIRHTCRVLIRLTLYGSLSLAALVTMLDMQLDDRLTVSLMIGALIVVGTPQLRPYALSFLMFAIMGIVFTRIAPTVLQTMVVLAAAVCLTAILFRLHYVSYCRAGWSTFDVPRRHSRCRHVIRAFFDALIAWVCYNRHESAVPGVAGTPAGSYRTRLRLTVTTVILLGLGLPYAAACVAWSKLPPDDLLRCTSPFLCLALPVPILLAACFLASASVLGKSYAIRKESEQQVLARCWQPMLEHFRTSPLKDECESLFLGQVEHDNAPLLVPLSTARRHIWVVGGTGSGKTTFLTSLVEQFGYRGDTSIIVGDLKADSYELLSSMEWVRDQLEERAKQQAESEEEAAERTRKAMPFWHLTNRFGCSSHIFSLFHQREWARLNATQRTDVLMAAMALSYSRSFGESWYSDACYHLLHYVVSKYPDIGSFRELSERVAYEIKGAPDHELSRAVKKDGEHARLVLERLASSDVFHQDARLPQAVRDNAVQLGRFFQEPCLMYCAFSSLLAPTSSPELLRVLVSALLTVGTMVNSRTTRVLLVLDEWQRMVAGNIELLLQQARSLGVTVVLANQTVADLKQGSIDLTHTVEGNTSLQAWFKDLDQAGMAQIKNFGGVTIDTMRDVSTSSGPNGVTHSVSSKEVTIDRFTTNEIAAASSRPNRFIVRVADNEGYAHYDGIPFVARYSYHIDEIEYRRRVARVWPGSGPEKIEVGAAAAEPSCPMPTPAAPSPASWKGPVIGSGSIETSAPQPRKRKRKR